MLYVDGYKITNGKKGSFYFIAYGTVASKKFNALKSDEESLHDVAAQTQTNALIAKKPDNPRGGVKLAILCLSLKS